VRAFFSARYFIVVCECACDTRSTACSAMIIPRGTLAHVRAVCCGVAWTASNAREKLSPIVCVCKTHTICPFLARAITLHVNHPLSLTVCARAPVFKKTRNDDARAACKHAPHTHMEENGSSTRARVSCKFPHTAVRARARFQRRATTTRAHTHTHIYMESKKLFARAVSSNSALLSIVCTNCVHLIVVFVCVCV